MWQRGLTELRYPGEIQAEPSQVLVDAYTKGKELLDLINNPIIPEDKKTAFTKFEDLETFGWTDHARLDRNLARISVQEKIQLDPIIREKRWPYSWDPSWRVVHWKHDRDSGPMLEHKQRKYPSTNAEFRAIFNPVYGIIVATKSLSPQGDSRSRPPLMAIPEDRMVPLRHWSDIMFLSWRHLFRPQNQSRRLWYIVHPRISTPETVEAAIATVGTEKRLRDELRCPGQFFRTDGCTEVSQLLGTAQGVGLAHLLIQHREHWNKKVERVMVWETLEPQSSEAGGAQESPCLPTIMFELESRNSDLGK